jgi:L-threonylcarbamoyladenylate synthase
MRTEVVSAGDPNALHYAVDVLRYDGLVAFPTDTVYGVGAPVFKADVVARLYPLKGRTADKAIAVLIAGLPDLARVAAAVPREAELLAEAFWPGALTLVLPKRPEVPAAVSRFATVGVRVPDLAFTRALLESAGPLAVTSANRSGAPSAVTAEEALAVLDGRIDLLIDGGRCPGGLASTVVDCTATPPRVLRAGPIDDEAIEAALKAPQGDSKGGSKWTDDEGLSAPVSS